MSRVRAELAAIALGADAEDLRVVRFCCKGATRKWVLFRRDFALMDVSLDLNDFWGWEVLGRVPKRHLDGFVPMHAEYGVRPPRTGSFVRLGVVPSTWPKLVRIRSAVRIDGDQRTHAADSPPPG